MSKIGSIVVSSYELARYIKKVDLRGLDADQHIRVVCQDGELSIMTVRNNDGFLSVTQNMPIDLEIEARLLRSLKRILFELDDQLVTVVFLDESIKIKDILI